MFQSWDTGVNLLQLPKHFAKMEYGPIFLLQLVMTLPSTPWRGLESNSLGGFLASNEVVWHQTLPVLLYQHRNKPLGFPQFIQLILGFGPLAQGSLVTLGSFFLQFSALWHVMCWLSEAKELPCFWKWRMDACKFISEQGKVRSTSN